MYAFTRLKIFDFLYQDLKKLLKYLNKLLEISLSKGNATI